MSHERQYEYEFEYEFECEYEYCKVSRDVDGDGGVVGVVGAVGLTHQCPLDPQTSSAHPRDPLGRSDGA